jgi:hypothetical protein
MFSGRDFATKIPQVTPNQNGFFHTVLTAYNAHHALVVRPDDVWLAILAQFSLFVTANAELLCASFVEHEGTRELSIFEEGDRTDVDFSKMALWMADLVDKHVADPTLRAWALPAFTTTTATDTTASAVLLLATVKKYFGYDFRCKTGCGIPRVTLAGEKRDWVEILARLEKLKEYGLTTTAWYHLLRPVVARFVEAFDAPASAENVDFWGRVVHHHKGSGENYYTGWINAFNVFSKRGAWIGPKLDNVRIPPLNSL